MVKHILSKSTFLRGNTCHKSLWLYKHRRDLAPPTSVGQQFIFDQGHEVGILAQQLFPDGIDASLETPNDYQPSLELTAKLISEGRRVIFEAAFQHDGVVAVLDILVKKDDGWYGYEVKASTKVNDINVTDAALQYWVMTGAGIELKDISIVHINNQYERNGAIEAGKLFTIESVLIFVKALQDEITQQVTELKTVSALESCPVVLIGKQCNSLYPCDFTEHCWKEAEVPDESILDFTQYRLDKRFELFHAGTKKIADITDWRNLKPPYNYVVETHRNSGFYLDPDPLKEFMSNLDYPLLFMDFETVSFALPPFDRASPYDQMTFQYSLHTLESEDAEPQHKAFLADPSGDFREEFIKSLLDDLGETGQILVWNIGFERSKLNALALLYPQYEDRINAVVARMVDLAIPFQKKWVYDNRLSCSYSIKSVLPFVAPDLNYDKLDISNGQDASLLFQQMMTEPGRDWSTERQHLLEYCQLDTWAMVLIYRYLDTLV
jgi:hypothetical protein